MSISTRADVMQKIAQGKGTCTPVITPTGTSVTGAAAASGHFSCQFRGNALTSTLPDTIDSYPLPPGLGSTAMLTGAKTISSGLAHATLYCWAYKLGTLNLTATGDQFTHDAATFPVLRTVFGAASTAIPLIPVVQITTATTTTAAIFRMRTAAGAAGYTDQDNNSVIGTKTITLPAAATVAASTYVMRLEEGDSAVRDISAIEVTTAAAAGAATVWGIEILASPHLMGLYGVSSHDSLFGGLALNEQTPAVATSGTATAYFTTLSLAGSTSTVCGFSWGVLNT